VLDALRGVPWPREYSFRFLKNKLTDEWAGRESEAFVAFGTLAPKYAQARAQNDLDSVAVVCGEAVGLLRDRPTAESIVKFDGHSGCGTPPTWRHARPHISIVRVVQAEEWRFAYLSRDVERIDHRLSV
jgi:hypothetical protein